MPRHNCNWFWDLLLLNSRSKGQQKIVANNPTQKDLIGAYMVRIVSFGCRIASWIWVLYVYVIKRDYNILSLQSCKAEIFLLYNLIMQNIPFLGSPTPGLHILTYSHTVWLQQNRKSNMAHPTQTQWLACTTHDPIYPFPPYCFSSKVSSVLLPDIAQCSRGGWFFHKANHFQINASSSSFPAFALLQAIKVCIKRRPLQKSLCLWCPEDILMLEWEH